MTDAVNLHVKLLSFSWDHKFELLKGGPFQVILELNFLKCTKMLVDVASRKFFFGFAPDSIGSFVRPQGNQVGASLNDRTTCTHSEDDEVTEALSCMFEGKTEETPEMCCATLWESLPLIYSSLEEYQQVDPCCKDLRAKVLSGDVGGEKFDSGG
jgi:hypothetical protein